jgi:hypothetical protein
MNKPKADRSKIKDTNIGILLSVPDKKNAQRVAQEEDISLSALARKAIREYCERYDEKKGVKVNG